jgi:hypothetical protein
MSPLQIAVFVIALVTIIGVIVSSMRKSSALAGYDEIRQEVPRIASALKAEMFRDGNDLVLVGNFNRRPTQVRFSYDENTPGLNIRMQAPVSFTFSVVPKGARATEGRVLVRTGNDMFDAKFNSRTDHPTQAKMLVGGRAALQHLEKLCCSQKTYVTLTRGSIEMSELIIPAPYTGRHVLDHVESMAIVAKAVSEIPGAESVKVVPYEREKSTPVFRIALVVGAVVAILGVFMIKPGGDTNLTAAAANDKIVSIEGVDAVDALKMQDSLGWHAMHADEYDPDLASSVRGIGMEANGRMTLDIDGDDQQDVAYLLRDSSQGQTRLVIFSDGNRVYSAGYANVVGALPVAKGSFDSIRWKVKPTKASTNQGIMLFRKKNDQLDPLILFVNGTNVVTGIPANWRDVPTS